MQHGNDPDSQISRVDGRLPVASTQSDSAAPTLRASLLGCAVDRYVVVAEIGEGGMGVVYKAYDPDLGRLIALKLVRSGAGGRHTQRLEREARAIARLAHPNVVAIYDVGMFGDELFIAMEYVEGQSLRRWLTAGSRASQAVQDVFLQAAHGLAAAHDAGLVHRDFKPDNVLIGDDGRVRVLDFGLARAPRGEAGDDELGTGLGGGDRGWLDRGGDPRLPLDGTMTPTGTAVGTPRYMAPEQHRGHACDGRADQYAWAVALYEALARQRPFDAADYKTLRARVLAGAPPPFPESAAVPRWLERLVLRALSVEPDKRYPSMHELVVELTEDRAAQRRAALDASADTDAMVAAFPPPDAAAASIRRLRGMLEEAWAKKSRGAVAPALVLARQLTTETATVDYLPLRAASLYLLGNLEHRMGDAAAARATLLAAARVAAIAGDDWQIANTWVFLVHVLGVGLGRADEAEAIAAVAEVALARVGENASLRSRLDNYRAASLAVAGRHDEAADALTRAVALDEITHGAHHAFLVVSLLNLAEVWLDAGQPERARPPLERARAICRPDDSAPTASRTRCLALLGRVRAGDGDPVGATALLDRAISIWERLPGRDRALADALVDRAACRRVTGDRSGAATDLARAGRLLGIAPERRISRRLAEELDRLDASASATRSSP